MAKLRCRTKVAGVSHPNSDGSSRQAIIDRCSPGERLQLIREPSNRYDPNAVKVCRIGGQQLGYLSAYLASDIAAEVADGSSYYAEITDLTGGTEDRPTRGVNVSVYYEQERSPTAPANSRRTSDPVWDYARAIQESYLDGYVSGDEIAALRIRAKELSPGQVKAAHAVVFANVLRTSAQDQVFFKEDEAFSAGVRRLLESLGWCP